MFKAHRKMVCNFFNGLSSKGKNVIKNLRKLEAILRRILFNSVSLFSHLTIEVLFTILDHVTLSVVAHSFLVKVL